MTLYRQQTQYAPPHDSRKPLWIFVHGALRHSFAETAKPHDTTRDVDRNAIKPVIETYKVLTKASTDNAMVLAYLGGASGTQF